MGSIQGTFVGIYCCFFSGTANKELVPLLVQATGLVSEHLFCYDLL